MTLFLFVCQRLSASISRAQCAKNRAAGQVSCTGCPGLPEESCCHVTVGPPPQIAPAAVAFPPILPLAASVREVCPNDNPLTITLHFNEPEDREIFHTLQNVCSDLEKDIISLLHLACRGDLSKLKGIKTVI